MRIAAGVLIIIVSLIDFAAGFTWGIGGAVGGSLGSAIVDQAKKDPNMSAEQKKDLEVKMKEAEAKMKEVMKLTGTALSGYGIFLLVLGILCIACAVCLFRAKAAGFVILVAVLQIAAEGVGLWNLGQIVGISNYFGIVACILAIVAATSYPKAEMSDR